ALNRITDAQFAGGGWYDRYSLHNVAYDKNGNITALERKGALADVPNSSTDFGSMDALTYGYDAGNRLLNVTDSADKVYGFRDGINTTKEYLYDDNGNIIVDFNKLLTIQYNYLNLPTRVFKNEGDISYIYDALGTKLRKEVTEGGSVTKTTDYAGNYIYEDAHTGDGSILQFFSHAEGYVTPNGSDYDYVYQYKDHLGNVRLSYMDANNNGSVTTDEIVEESNYYPFGLKHRGYNYGTSPLGNSAAQRWKYNSVELEESLDLNLYEMSFRQYDPAVGRFTSMDPVVHYSMSTYNAFDNNPVFWMDPSGADSSIGADGLTNEQWVQLSRPGGGGFDAMRAQARQNFQNEIESERNVGSVSSGDLIITGDILDKPNRKIDPYSMTKSDLLMYSLLWAIYLEQNDINVLMRDFVDISGRSTKLDWLNSILGYDPTAVLTFSNLTAPGIEGTAQLNILGQYYIHNYMVSEVRWTGIGGKETIGFGTWGKNKNRESTIWDVMTLKFSNKSKGDYYNGGELAKYIQENVFNPSRHIYDPYRARFMFSSIHYNQLKN
ncbi:hypothetical protein OOZ15_17610, partial [Galbibacter sp. EGI 63066]|uniref:RHS repeat domain-containing protein n=1 Tax=Galbibacter sp. EGI 63066 TaxID=2993559 RepID=UPI002B05B17F